MKSLACGICGSIERATVYESTVKVVGKGCGDIDPYSAHYRINRCLECGLLYSSPIFDPHEVSELYTRSPHTNIGQGEEANVRSTMEGYYALARAFLSSRHRFLDIGCDIGVLLEVARQDGFQEVYGVEPNPVAASLAEGVQGAIIVQNFYETQEFSDDYFDLVSLIHVVDHLLSPVDVLSKARRELKPGGVILAVVHNVESWLARRLGEHFPPYNIYHHYFFSPITLRRLFQRCGFEVLKIVPTCNHYSLGFLTEKIPWVPMRVRQISRGMLCILRLSRVRVKLTLGNIGIVARRPLSDHSEFVNKFFTGGMQSHD